jgi:2-polyprenyl-3-methyl-5-hydroxy-6-metoxy-1,4-benzoquinol methylase
MSYEGYFRHRNVSPSVYDNYRLPTYVLDVLPQDRSTRILDIGCGFGHLLRALQGIGYENAEGVDVSPEAVEHSIESGLKVTRISDLTLYCEEQREPTYGLVIMNHVLEHIEKSRIIPTVKTIRERLLVSDGSFLVMVPNAQSNTGCYWAYEDFTHTTLFTAGSLLFVLSAAGFETIRFLDPDGLEESRPAYKAIKKLLLGFYRRRMHFWNLVTNSSFHQPSPKIFTFELKALAR